MIDKCLSRQIPILDYSESSIDQQKFQKGLFYEYNAEIAQFEFNFLQNREEFIKT